MKIKFADIERQELYEKLFNIYWNNFKDNYEEYCKYFEKIKLENTQSLQPEETIFGKIFSSYSFNFVDEGFSYENIDIANFYKNINSYRFSDTIPVLQNINRESVKEYSKKYKQAFKNEEDQRIYEQLYKLYCKKHKINPKLNSVYYNAIYFRCFQHVSTKTKYFNKHEIVKSDNFNMSIILRGLGFKYQKKEDSISKVFPVFDTYYPFWSVPDLALRVGFWFGTYYLLDVLFQLQAPVWYFLTFLISQLLFLGIISMLFKTGKL